MNVDNIINEINCLFNENNNNNEKCIDEYNTVQQKPLTIHIHGYNILYCIMVNSIFGLIHIRFWKNYIHLLKDYLLNIILWIYIILNIAFSSRKLSYML